MSNQQTRENRKNNCLGKNTPVIISNIKHQLNETKSNSKQSVNELDKVAMVSNFQIYQNSIPILVPLKIKRIMRGLNEKYSNTEYSIFGKTLFQNNSYIMTEEYFIPLQEVTSVHINFLEDNTDFNTVIHKHPGSGPSNFSAEDEKYINSNFKYSLLWCGGNFVKGLCRLTDSTSNINVMVPLQIKIIEEQPIFPEEATEKIQTKSYEFSSNTYGGFFNRPVHYNFDKNEFQNTIFDTPGYREYRAQCDLEDKKRQEEHIHSGILNKTNSDLFDF